MTLSFCTHHPVADYGLDTLDVTAFIRSRTTPEELSEKLKEFPDYRFNKISIHEGRLNWTALSCASKKGNALLAQYIIECGGPSLMTTGTLNELFPLHYAVTCKSSKRGYKTVEKLIQLGNPVNLVGTSRKEIAGIVHYDNGPTALEVAIRLNRSKIASLLIRMGGIVTNKALMKTKTAKKALKRIKNENEKLFLANLIGKKILPEEVIQIISGRLLQSLTH